MKLLRFIFKPRKTHQSRDHRSYLPKVRRPAALVVNKAPRSTIKPSSSSRTKIKPVTRNTISKALILPRLQRVIIKKISPALQRGRTSPLLDIPQRNSNDHSICRRRSDRRRLLFQNNIAGTNLRKSPGSGGTYIRTPDSQTSCRS